MSHQITEIKARCPNLARAERVLRDLGARHVGRDLQVDTYFHCTQGRLKLREGNIERSLIAYTRPDQAGPKHSEVTMTAVPPDLALKPVLSAALGVLVEVVKERQIWFVDNVKVHLDRLEGLGEFVEVEAIDLHGDLGAERRLAQCQALMSALGVEESDLLSSSYSDMLLARAEC
ncbi:MAG: class IV adenylate cyclase [Armatimonadetes bacterium]|nr:class IV adenylate cyclase [Armatimonadota bacterium]